jgi:hypothetical protein
MLYFLPSSDVDRVRPVTACFVAVYGAEFGRGTCAEIDPLLMIRPAVSVVSPTEMLLGYKKMARLDSSGRPAAIAPQSPLPTRQTDSDSGVIE